ncbi:MAG: prolipoprotein diacylglyceryl transferase [Balneolales bacterium]|nr:prolipoprotein diacylglyceryl transferase [Balneolales bacterium]
MNQSYFVWPGDPIMFELGVFQLPFSVSIPGLGLSILLIYFAYSWLDKTYNPKPVKRKVRARDRNNETTKPSQIPKYYVTASVVSSLILGQLLFLALPGPDISQIGPIQMRWYGFGFAMAFLLGYFIGSAMFKHAGYKQEDADSLLTYLFIGTILGARLGEVIFYNPEYYLRNPSEILMIWRGGLASHGAFIGNILAIWLYVKQRPHISYIWVLDRMTIPFAIGGVFVRIGNFFNSEIYGLPTDVSWAVIFQQVDLQPRHPSMLYEAAVGVLLFIVLWTMYKKWNHKPPAGALFGMFLTILFSARFLVEITKVEQADFAVNWIVGMGQLLSIPLVIAGLYILIKRVDWSQKTIETPPKEEKTK